MSYTPICTILNTFTCMHVYWNIVLPVFISSTKYCHNALLEVLKLISIYLSLSPFCLSLQSPASTAREWGQSLIQRQEKGQKVNGSTADIIDERECINCETGKFVIISNSFLHVHELVCKNSTTILSSKMHCCL